MTAQTPAEWLIEQFEEMTVKFNETGTEQPVVTGEQLTDDLDVDMFNFMDILRGLSPA